MCVCVCVCVCVCRGCRVKMVYVQNATFSEITKNVLNEKFSLKFININHTSE